MMNSQPTAGQWLPIAAMIGVLAALSVWLTQAVIAPMVPWFAGTVWALFITWGAWFSVGARLSRLPKFCVGVVGGVVFGWITLFLMGFANELVGATWGLPLTVFFVATTIVMLELTDLFELAFVYFFSYASFFAYVFGGFDKQPESMGQLMQWAVQGVHFLVLLFLGLGFALVNVWLKNMIFDVEKVPFDHRNTIYDKEQA